MDPQQELFIELLSRIKELGYDVYDGALPPDNTPYPFVYLGDSQLVDDNGNKSVVLGKVFQKIHVWSNKPYERGTLSSMLLAIKQVCRKVNKTNRLSWSVRNINQRILPDNTTKQPLLHGVLEAEFEIN
jgi:hypothetical protein